MSSPPNLLQAGLQALEQNRFVEAVTFLEQACHTHPDRSSKDYVRSQINLAKAYQRTGQTEKAIALCEQLIQHPNSQVQQWAQQALESLKRQCDRPEEVAAQTENCASTLTDQPSQDLFKTGGDAFKQKRFAEAIESLEAFCNAANKTDPNYTQAQIWLARSYKGNQQFEEAIVLTQQLAQSSEQMIQTWAQQFLMTFATEAILQVVQPSINSAKGEEAVQTKRSRPTLKSLSELKTFYEKYLLRDLRDIEKQRKTVLKQVQTSTAICIIVPLIITVLILQFSSNLWLLLIVPNLALMVWVALYSYTTGEYARLFKKFKIVEKLIQGIDPGLTYTPYGSASQYSGRTAFEESQLFKKFPRPDFFHEDDGVAGTIGETYITFSEICAECNAANLSSWNLNRDDRGYDFFAGLSFVFKKISRGQRLDYDDFLEVLQGEAKRDAIFKGILFAANFNKQFQFQTFVLPDRAEALMGLLGQKLQAMNKQYGQLVKLEDREFEKRFVVYGEDQIEARYILSTSLMERLVQFQKRSRRDVSVSFVNNSIYVAIAYDEDLFEPKLYQSMLDFRPIQDYYENLQLVIGIVQDLNLNRRIWAKGK